jgi:UDP-N-acetylmuramyl pentapeptide synthase
MKHQEAFPSFDFYPNVGALLDSGRLKDLPARCAVLVKGSRSMGMERCLEGLGVG